MTVRTPAQRKRRRALYDAAAGLAGTFTFPQRVSQAPTTHEVPRRRSRPRGAFDAE
jgi:hypothetical protein